MEKKDIRVEVMKASAGSGKTFALSREYLRLVLMKEEGARFPDRENFRHILAVTFTNKATAEMKSRIIDELDTLASYVHDSDFRDYLMKECGYEDEKTLSQAARNALSAILNDYGSFSVTTIDKFFQIVLRAFAREIGQFPDYQIDLDRRSMVTEASDRVMDSLSEATPELLDWLSEASAQLIEDGFGGKVSGTVREFALGLFSETYDARVKAAGIDTAKAFSQENLMRMQELCNRIIKEYDPRLRKAVDEAVRVLSSMEDGLADRKGTTVLKELKALDFHNSIVPEGFCSTFYKAVEDGKACFLKNDKRYSAADYELVREALAAVRDIVDSESTIIRNSAIILCSQVYVFRLAEKLRAELDALQKEKRTLGIEDTNSMLRDIINGTDAPFIYEKMGVKYHHFLLDEFQDTSRIQWDNFLPLLRNSIAEGCYNLVVGDVKQSIYRWRNADWKILDSEVAENLSGVAENPLDTNWRSAPAIIDFNNAFYRELSSHMSAMLNSPKTEQIYSDVRQECSGKIGIPGSVDITICAKNIYDNAVVAAVADAVSRGFKLKDIGVLVRRNSEGALLAAAIKEAGYDVVTNDSLTIGSSPLVRRLAAQLNVLDHSESRVQTYYAEDFDPESCDAAGTLEDMVEQMLRQIRLDYASDPEEFRSESAYVLAFIDLIRDYEASNGNSLSGFLRYWEESGRNKSISSAEGVDAVTIMTIHKSKGLSFPFVIVLSNGDRFQGRNDGTWLVPDVAGTPFESLEKSIYHVRLSDKSSADIFAARYLEEKELSYVDSINTAYVATTRAEQAMHIVSPLHGALKTPVSSWEKASDLCAALNIFASGYEFEDGSSFVQADPLPGTVPEPSEDGFTAVRYVFGERGPKWEKPAGRRVKPERRVESIPLRYDCADISNGEPVGKSKVRISNEAKDFFGGDGVTGASASNRIRGTVLHKVLETVYAPGDLARSIRRAVDCGELSPAEAADAQAILSKAICAEEVRGWFPGDRTLIMDERPILSKGETEVISRRADRVVIRPDGGVDIIDYKFGKPETKHQKQVKEYAELYRRMGYKDVRAYLWYIDADNPYICPVN